VTTEPDPMRWLGRGITGVTLVIGWVFILWQNNFRITVPVVVIAIGFLAIVLGVVTLWRVGVAAVAPDDDDPATWTRPIGARGELDKEKKTLLKAIKEAEFDLAMGKLSQRDADDLIRMYRARAIEVIKELDRIDSGGAGSAREQIERELQARLALDNRPSKKDKRKAATAAKSDAKSGAKADPKAATTAGDGKSDRKGGGGDNVDVDTNPVETDPVETDPVETDEVETDPVKTPADESSPEDRAAERANKSTEATS
jgi:hypothetical protein